MIICFQEQWPPVKEIGYEIHETREGYHVSFLHKGQTIGQWLCDGLPSESHARQIAVDTLKKLKS